MNPLRALLCVDGAAPDKLFELAVPLVAQPAVWVPTHIVDVRGRRDLGLLRGGISGVGPLSRSQQEAITGASGEHTRSILDAAEATLRRRGLALEPPQIRVGEPAMGAGLIVLFASRRANAGSGPHSVGHTARFVLDHASCPVLLVRGSQIR